jgi:hypothetical protein
MPSPFPGMNPYLEAPSWAGVHHWLITELAKYLNSHLSPDYYVAVEVRVYEMTDVDESESTLIGIPDNAVIDNLEVPGKNKTPSQERSTAVATAVATLAKPVIVVLPMTETVKEGYLELRQAGTHKVITAIEVLSPKNKQPGKGRLKYEEKRQEILNSRTHLVEIDLIRKFKPIAFAGTNQESHYRILVSRSEKRPRAALYAFNLPDPIPVFPLPLQLGEPELPVDLKLLLDNLYDLGRYDLQIDYAQTPPAPKLSADETTWCDRLLQENHLRAG